MDDAFSTSVAELDFRLWLDVPANSWKRRQGETRALIIDDQFIGRSRMFRIAEDAPTRPEEELLYRWLNTRLQFFPMPEDYKVADGMPTATFSDTWFENNLTNLLRDPRPIAAIFLDLLFGDKEGTIDNASGRRFLWIIRQFLPHVPIIILSNVSESFQVRSRLKESEDPELSGRLDSFQAYLKKRDPDKPQQKLIERMAHTLVEWGELADPSLAAYSMPMRRVARDMRQLALYDKKITFEDKKAGEYCRPVIFLGPWGSGKNFLADYLHETSRRRAHPYERLTFTNIPQQQSAGTTLFGNGPYTNAPEEFHVDVRTGAVVARMTSGRKRTMSANEIALGRIGALQRLDTGRTPGPYNRPPLKGTLLLDELGATDQKTQSSLVIFFNRGRFMPTDTDQEIPTERTLDLWLLFASTLEAFGGMAEDLRSRLTRGATIMVPSLAQRSGDVVALALNELPPSKDSAFEEQGFKPEAIAWLQDAAGHFEFRILRGLLGKLTGEAPFAAGELEQAFQRYLQTNPDDARRLKAARIAMSARGPSASTASEMADTRDGTIEFTPGPAVPKTIDDYEVLESLGSGNMGIVYKARKAGSDDVVALKIIQKDLLSSPQAVQRFAQETNTLKQLAHPNIVNLLAAGTHERRPYFTMNFVQGTSLAQRAAGGPIEARQAADWVRQIALAVQHCHNKNILHRDLKPANVLLDRDEKPWIADFGLAKWLNTDAGQTQDGTIMGTPHYMSPEQAAGHDSKIGPASDIYALGAILYRLLLWRPPFATPDCDELLKQIVREPPVPPRRLDPSLDPELEAICLRCLAKAPADRFASANDVAQELLRFWTKPKQPFTHFGGLDRVTASAAMDILTFIDKAIEEKKGFSIMSLYRFITGKDKAPNANMCRTHLVRLLLVDKAATQRAMQSSERLDQFVRDIGKRSKQIKMSFPEKKLLPPR